MKRVLGGSWAVALLLSGCADGRAFEAVAGDPELNDREGQRCIDSVGERECGPESEGLQFCADLDLDGERAWGACYPADDLECELGDSEPCSGDRLRNCVLEGEEPVWTECFDPFEPQGEPEPGGGEEDTPLVLVFPGDELAFEPAGTATFSIAGECITHDWPTPATPWLAIDLDRSGSIDDGRELFGSGTVLRDGSHARHGFAALAELDTDGDGMVTPADPRFGELLLWSDHDRDRQSTHAELEPLASRGIAALPVAFDRDRTCDDRGNCAVERASVGMVSGSAAAVVDVHLACQ